MSLLIPLGLLGLISIIALILIYVLKPNYQQKYISSTFVWKLSIKYKKKRIPISKLRNIILILCQVAILIAGTLILAKPVHMFKSQVDQSELIVILDSSASMRAENGTNSRYERAIEKASVLTSNMLNNDGIVSFIIADAEPHYLQLSDKNGSIISVLRMNAENGDKLKDTLADMSAEADENCSYGVADVEAALTLCEEILDVNPAAEIYFYTDENYSFVPSGINVVDVSESDEWNASVLSAEAVIEENYYSFTVEVASYGKNIDLTVNVDVSGVNASERNPSGEELSFSVNVLCDNDETKTVVFKNENLIDPDEASQQKGYTYYAISDRDKIATYKSIRVYIEEDDSFLTDNDFYIYGGEKPVLKVQYVTSLRNPFVNTSLLVIRNNKSFKNLWDMQISEPRGDYAMSGFDLYIFEHMIPDRLPADGIVLLLDPPSSNTDMALRLGRTIDYRGELIPLVPADTHPILKNINPSTIAVSRFTSITSYDNTYKVLATCDGFPTLMVREEESAKIVVMPFSVHYSNLSMTGEFPLLVLNMFKYFLPATVTSNSFEVNERVELNSRGTDLTIVSATGDQTVYDTFPKTTTFTRPGVYQLVQLPYGAVDVLTEQIYINIPAKESNIKSVANTLRDPRKVINEFDLYDDLVLWFAAALAALLFIEWLLQARDNM